MKNYSTCFRVAFACFFLNTAVQSHAQIETSEINLGLQLGSTGIGLQAATRINEKVQLRTTVSFMQLRLKKEFSQGDIQTSRTRLMRTGGVGLISDWQLLKKTDKFRLSGGLYYVFNKLEETRAYSFNDEGTIEDMGLLTIAVESFPINLYGGLLIGKIDPEKKMNILLDIGTMFHGRPKVDFTGGGRVEPTADQDDIVRDNLKNYNFYPNINVLLFYRLNSKKTTTDEKF